MRQLLPLTVLLVLGLGACEKDSCTQTWTQVVSVPVTLARDAVQDSIAAMPARELCTGGNLYAYGDYVFVNANREGYHLLDNRDPAAPVNLAFLRIPGATHMAFVDGRMVSDSYADMVVLDFRGPTQLTLLSSTPNMLLQTDGFTVDQDRVAIGFEEQEVEFTQSCDGGITLECWGCRAGGDVFFSADAAGGLANGGGGNPQINTGGSLARLAFCDRSLYVLASNQLAAFALQDDRLHSRQQTPLPFGQEALVRDGDFLYVASTWGMTIFSIVDCGLPLEIGGAPRFWSNDPVAIEGDRAVVTLRSGDVPTVGVPGTIIVYDISDRRRPREIARHAVPHPIGVALHDGVLYVCDAVEGLQVYDFAGGAPTTLLSRRLQTVAEADAVDLAVLPYAAGTVLLTIGNRTVSQYSVAAGGELTNLSNLEAERCNAL